MLLSRPHLARRAYPSRCGGGRGRHERDRAELRFSTCANSERALKTRSEDRTLAMLNRAIQLSSLNP